VDGCEAAEYRQTNPNKRRRIGVFTFSGIIPVPVILDALQSSNVTVITLELAVPYGKHWP